jgi:hypothetical protein
VGEQSCVDVPAVLLLNSRCGSRVVGNSIEISDRLPPEQKLRTLAHGAGVVDLRKRYGEFDLIPSISPIPGLTHVSHLIDHLVQAGDRPALDWGDAWPTTSPHQQVSVRAACNVHRTQPAFVTGISLPLNRPHSGCYALITWATSRLSRETSCSPTMLVSRRPGSRDWRVGFVSGTLFDNGLWLADSVQRPDVVVLHGAWELYWSLDGGHTFSQLSGAQWDTLGCSPWGMRSIFGAAFGGDDLRLALWERTVKTRNGAIESWSLPLHPDSVPRLLERKELPLREALRHVATVMTASGDQSGPLRVSVVEHRPARSWVDPRTWLSRSPQAEPMLHALVGEEWSEVPLAELLLNTLAEASVTNAAV